MSLSLFDRTMLAAILGLVMAMYALGIIWHSDSNDDSHNHHPITVIERKVDRVKAKQSAQIAADRRTLHQLTRAMELLR